MTTTIDLPHGAAAALDTVTYRILTRLSNYDDASTAPERQRDDGEFHIGQERDRLARDGIVVAYDRDCNLYHDYASGFDELADRPELERLLRDLRPGDVVVVTRLDRLARNTFRLLGLLRDVHQRGASVRFLSPDINSRDANGQITIVVLAALAEAESRNTSVRVSRAKAERTGVGAYMGGPVPYGWKTVRKGRYLFLDLDPKISGQLLEIVEWFLVERVNVTEAVRRLNADPERYPTPSRIELDRQIEDWAREGRDITKIKQKAAEKWNTKTLKAILSSPLMLGKSMGSKVVGKKGEPRRDGRGVRRSDQRVKVINTDPETGEELVSHAPLLDLQTYTELQQRLHATATGPQRRRRTGGARLGTLIVCRDCSGPCYGPSEPRPGNNSYQCRTKGLGGACVGNSVSARSLEALVRLLVIVTLSRPGVLDRLIEHYEQEAAADLVDPASDPTAPERERLNRKLTRLMQAERDGDHIDEAPGHFALQKDKLERQIAGLRAQRPAPRPLALDLRPFRGKPIADTWDSLSRVQQLAVLKLWIERIELTPSAHHQPAAEGHEGAFDPSRLSIVWRNVTGEVAGVTPWALPPLPAREVDAAACPDCPRTFASPAAVRAHAATAHRSSSPCPECSQQFGSAKALRKHVQSEHASGDLSCGEPGCTRTFRMRAHVVSHQRTHRRA